MIALIKKGGATIYWDMHNFFIVHREGKAPRTFAVNIKGDMEKAQVIAEERIDRYVVPC